MDADELVRAIRAALDETERIARAAEGACWHVDYCDDYGRPFHELFDPAAVLRRVAADREIVERHARFDFPPDPEDGPGYYSWTARCDHCYKDWPCPDLLSLASGLGINPEEETP